MKAQTVAQLTRTAEQIREDIITTLVAAGSGHAAGSLGQADIYAALYFNIMNHDPKKPDWPERDRLVQSNGHTVPVRYVAMARAGYFPIKELKTLRQLGSRLQGHPEKVKLPGLETTSGPLGSGLSQAAGMALALKIDGKANQRIYCVMGDGELNEGNIWEAAMFAPSKGLGNLTAIVDRNNIQIDGPTETVMPLDDLAAKWEAFGWHVVEIDGHNLQHIIDACNLARAVQEKPTLIIARTIPGKGVPFMENDYHWHGYFVNTPGAPEGVAEQAKKALHDLRTLQGRIIGEHE